MAKAAFWQRGETLDYKNTGNATIDANTILLYGKRLGVVGCDIVPGEVGSLHVTGIFKLPKASSTAITAGAEVYWDATNSVITTTSTNNTLVGFAAQAAAADDETVLVSINA